MNAPLLRFVTSRDFLTLSGVLFLYQMRDPGEFSRNMCSDLHLYLHIFLLPLPPILTYSHPTHITVVCVSLWVCVILSHSLSSPSGPLQQLLPLRTVLCSQVIWGWLLDRLRLKHITPEIVPIHTSSPITLASLLTSITISVLSPLKTKSPWELECHHYIPA